MNFDGLFARVDNINTSTRLCAIKIIKNKHISKKIGGSFYIFCIIELAKGRADYEI